MKKKLGALPQRRGIFVLQNVVCSVPPSDNPIGVPVYKLIANKYPLNLQLRTEKKSISISFCLPNLFAKTCTVHGNIHNQNFRSEKLCCSFFVLVFWQLFYPINYEEIMDEFIKSHHRYVFNTHIFCAYSNILA